MIFFYLTVCLLHPSYLNLANYTDSCRCSNNPQKAQMGFLRNKVQNNCLNSRSKVIIVVVNLQCTVYCIVE